MSASTHTLIALPQPGRDQIQDDYGAVGAALIGRVRTEQAEALSTASRHAAGTGRAPSLRELRHATEAVSVLSTSASAPLRQAAARVSAQLAGRALATA